MHLVCNNINKFFKYFKSLNYDIYKLIITKNILGQSITEPPYSSKSASLLRLFEKLSPKFLSSLTVLDQLFEVTIVQNLGTFFHKKILLLKKNELIYVIDPESMNSI